jgi:dihydroorotate dehydrogenase electron transfer subunit
MVFQTVGTVVKNERLQSIYFLLEIDCPPIANCIRPGQFVMLKISEGFHPILRRPFSVYKSYPEDHPDKKQRGRLSVQYKVVGKGTQKMTEFREGEQVDLIGPLGNGFTLPDPLPSSNILLLGGGVGVVTLYPLGEVLGGRKLSVFVGGRTKKDLLCIQDFKNLKATLFTATEDGSAGFKGTVTDLFSSHLRKMKNQEKNYLYSCGPIGMLRELAQAIAGKGLIAQASLEARMGCGFGACWGCTVRTRDPQAPYQRVCKEGPVFHFGEIDWGSQ